MDIEPEVIETPEVEEEVIEQPEAEQAEEAEETGLVVNLDGEEEDEAAPDWVNRLRRENRELKKWRKEQEAKLATAVTVPKLRPKPTSEDHDYDNEAFAEDLEKWFAEKADFDKHEAEAKAAQKRLDERWQTRVQIYEQGKEKLGVKDYDDAEAVVTEILSRPMLGIPDPNIRMTILLDGVDDPNTLIYALAKNPEQARKLAEIESAAQFAVALGKLEKGMKINRGGTKAPAPEKRIGGGIAAGVTATNDRTLDKLLEEAEKTGNYSKVAAYKRQARGG